MRRDYIQAVRSRLFRNRYGIYGKRSQKNCVNIECFPGINIGDTLGPVIVDWMLEKRGILRDHTISKTRHLMTVGSLLSMGMFDSTVWGTGILSASLQKKISRNRSLYLRKLDVRAVRGPLTREILIKAGYSCPEVYGDPAILMPLIYVPKVEKKYKKTLILHFRDSDLDHFKDVMQSEVMPEEIAKYGIDHILDPRTADYRRFIDELAASEQIISESLHGIILAESYNVPTAFLNHKMNAQLTKYYDWYSSTGRDTIINRSISEAVQNGPAVLPDLTDLRRSITDVFPYDLWEE